MVWANVVAVDITVQPHLCTACFYRPQLTPSPWVCPSLLPHVAPSPGPIQGGIMPREETPVGEEPSSPITPTPFVPFCHGLNKDVLVGFKPEPLQTCPGCAHRCTHSH